MTDEVGNLLLAVGNGDVEAFAAFYDRTASAMFSLLGRALEEPAAAERAMVRVYLRVWRTAASFDPARTWGGGFLLQAVYRELDRRDRPSDDEDGLRPGCTPARRDRRRRPLTPQRHR